MAERGAARVVHILDHYDAAAPDALRAHLAARGLLLDIRRMDRGEAAPVLGPGSAGLCLTGGLQMVTDIDDLPWMQEEIGLIRAAMARGLPVLGICLGAQMLAHALGGTVAPHPDGCGALGWYETRPTAAGRALLPAPLTTLSGNLQGFSLPPGAELLAAGDLFPAQMFRAGSALGLQFHPEVTAPLLEQWNRELAGEILLPGQQSEAARLAGFAAHDAAVKAWFAELLDAWFGLADQPGGGAPI